MPRYVCRKDKTDLTELVRRELEARGHHIASIDPLVEGLPDAQNEFGERGTFLASEAEGVYAIYGNLIRVVVTCPTDDVVNVFPVEES